MGVERKEYRTRFHHGVTTYGKLITLLILWRLLHRNVQGEIYYEILVRATRTAFTNVQDIDYTPYLPDYLNSSQKLDIQRGSMSLMGV